MGSYRHHLNLHNKVRTIISISSEANGKKVILYLCLLCDTITDSNPVQFDLYDSKIYVFQTDTKRLRELLHLSITF